MTTPVPGDCLFRGKHLSLWITQGWEFAARNITRPAVGIVAITDAGGVLLVEQHRLPAGQNVFELPAGLAGDVAGSEDEDLLEAAKRELHEETGYVASRWAELITGYSSPGLTNESIVLFLAEGLVKKGTGGGDATENIIVHEIPWGNVTTWLHERGARADLKLLAGLYAAEQHLRQRRGTP